MFDINKMQGAVHKAFQRTQKVGNVESDPDLALYKSLKPEHFTALMQQHGEQPVIDYIKDMEHKKIKGGK